MKALISVSDKTGAVELAHALTQRGFEILSTGGTAQALRQAEIPTSEVSDLTGFPEILSGRVKTLHPKIFGGILYLRGDAGHRSDVSRHEIPSIDWVVVNLYPFEKISKEDKLPPAERIEFIDIGGVSLLRAAAKNFEGVVVLCDAADYAPVARELEETGQVSPASRRRLAAKAFAHTAHYDSMIARFFREGVLQDVAGLKARPEKPGAQGPDAEFYFPTEMTVGLRKVQDLRYGENPQQRAALYEESGARDWGVVHAEKLQGKELSFNNYLDLDSAWQIANCFQLGPAEPGARNAPAFQGVACAIIKHNNPCGVAIGATAREAFERAFQADPLSAFGGVIGFSSGVDAEAASEIGKTFFECIIAPDFAPGALEVFRKKQNLRLLKQKHSLSLPYELDYKKISGGLLVQDKDQGFSAEENRQEAGEWVGRLGRAVTKRAPTPEEVFALDFAWRICKYVKSNAIVLAQGTVTCGVGAGQMSRIDSLKIAVQKMIQARYEMLGTASALGPGAAPVGKIASSGPLPLAMASDAFFPFRDCVDEAAKAGVTAIVQPGGSIRDADSIEAANEHNLAMIFTGMRHFRH